MRNFVKWTIIVVLLLAVIYALGWFFIARTVKARIFALLEGQEQQNVIVTCEDVDYKGFPVEFGFFCEGLHVRDRVSDTVFDTPQLLAEAPVYSPWTVLATVTGPATLQDDSGMLLRTEWQHLGGKLIYKGGGPRLVSFELDSMTARYADPLGNQGTLTAEEGQGLVRNDDGDLDVALTLNNAVLRPQNNGEALPAVSLNLLATVDQGGPLLEKNFHPQMLRGKSGIINQAALTIGESQSHMAVSGRFAFDSEGYLDGRFSFEMTGIDGLSELLQLSFPEAAGVIDTVTGLVKGFAGGQRTMRLDVRVTHGKAVLGFIPLGQIPPL